MAVTAFPFAFPGVPNVRCLFTTRYSGNLSLHAVPPGSAEHAAITGARRALLAANTVSSWTELQQVHGDALVLEPDASSPDALPTLEADGQASTRPGHALCIKTADCQALLLAHPKGCIAALHVGWRGNTLHFPRTAVERFCAAYGLLPEELRAVRGPSLGHAEFVNFSREWPAEFAPWYDSPSKTVDLWGLTRQQLQDAGVRPEYIYGLDYCTQSMPDLFFSHRNRDAGRQAALIWVEHLQ